MTSVRQYFRTIKDQLTSILGNGGEASAAADIIFEDVAGYSKTFVFANGDREITDSIGGPFIVAGDFNDIPDCYAVRTIRGKDMHDAYADAAFGPTITYHGDKFYFRIDQVLYKGPFKAVDIERGDIASSDHNPLLTTFLFDQAGK